MIGILSAIQKKPLKYTVIHLLRKNSLEEKGVSNKTRFSKLKGGYLLFFYLPPFGRPTFYFIDE